MEKVFVCDDTGGSKWYYADGVFTRENGSGYLIGKIRGQSLPDPVELWKARCDRYGVPHNRVDIAVGNGAIRLKPTNATFKLWEHWQEVQKNADPD